MIKPSLLAIRAELVGSDTCTALGITVRGYAPVLDLCRALIAVGHDPTRPLEAWRGDVLALRVRSISEGAKLTVGDDRFGRPTFRRWTGPPGDAGAAPVAQKGSGGAAGTSELREPGTAPIAVAARTAPAHRSRSRSRGSSASPKRR
jgi:hypothetical protein